MAVIVDFNSTIKSKVLDLKNFKLRKKEVILNEFTFVFLEKGLMMAIARVSSFDFTTPESMRNALQRYREEREKIFPHLELSMCVNTGPSSFVDIAVYPNQKMADSNKEARQKFHDDVFGASLKDEFFYEGDIDYFYQSENFKKLSF